MPRKELAFGKVENLAFARVIEEGAPQQKRQRKRNQFSHAAPRRSEENAASRLGRLHQVANGHALDHTVRHILFAGTEADGWHTHQPMEPTPLVLNVHLSTTGAFSTASHRCDGRQSQRMGFVEHQVDSISPSGSAGRCSWACRS